MTAHSWGLRLLGLVAVLALTLCAVGCSDREETAPARPGVQALDGPRPDSETAKRVIAAVSIPDSLERVAALASLLSGVGEEALPDVLAAFEYAQPLLDDSEWMLLADWWTRFDPRAALGWVRSKQDFRFPGALRYVIAGMARVDSEGALLALLTLRSREQRDAAFQGIIKAWNPVDPDGLLQYIVDLTPGRERQRAISTLVGVKTRQEGVPSTRRWAEALSEDLPRGFKLQVYRRLASELALIDPASGRSFVEAHVAPGSGLYRKFGVVAVEADPEGTLAWLGGLPEGMERDEGVQETYRRWVRNDSEKAQAWMTGAPPEPWREPALEIYALTKASTDPIAALELAAGIRDDARRKYTRLKTLVAWHARDPDASIAWLDASKLQPEVRQEIHRRIDQHAARRQQDAARKEAHRLRRQQRDAVAR